MTQAHLTVHRTGPNSVRLRITGALDSLSMEAGLQALTLEMEGMDHGDMLIIDEGAEWPTLGAIAVELRHWPQMIAVLRQIDRVAFVSRNSLFRSAVAFESALIPGLEIRNFTDEASANAWSAEARTAT